MDRKALEDEPSTPTGRCRRRTGSVADGIAPLEPQPARIYDLRSTFASNALAAGITVYELAWIMGTSVSMIEAHDGALIDTARESLLERLDAVGRAR